MYHRYFYLSNRILKTTNIMYVVRPIHTTRSIIIIIYTIDCTCTLNK